MSQQFWPFSKSIAYGGDYNPEQWPREVWDEDVKLMREAGVNFVSVGIFSWAMIEISENEYDFSWLDELLDLLHAHEIKVDLATPTASPPAWFFAAYPHARAINADGVPMGFGSRGMASHSSPEYHEAIVRYANKISRRYADHPAVVMWHVHNEYGVPVGEDFSEQSVQAWRRWLQEKYTDIAGVNEAWGTAFWGQRYTTFDHIPAPARTPSAANPAMQLDWARFTDDQIRACFIRERDAIRAHASQPITTNFMAHQAWNTDLWKWAKEVDIVSDDHYLWSPDPDAHIGLALAADLTRSVAGGKPWVLMEHSTSAVNWQGRNIAKRPGEMHRNALTHVARGADAVMFFQWRASRRGAEKFHSAMVPHAGTNSRIFQEVKSLGQNLQYYGAVQGSLVRNNVAILYDWESLWAQDLEWRPSDALGFREQMRTYYERLWRDGISVDFAHPSHDLSSYELVVAPASYLLRSEDAENLTRYVENGGTLVVACFAAAVDEYDAVHPDGFGAPLKTALGVSVEEYLPLRESETSTINYQASSGQHHALTATIWTEDLTLFGAKVVGQYEDGPAAESAPAITRNALGAGHGWYISANLSVTELAPVFSDIYADANLSAHRELDGVEILRRHHQDAEYVFVINHLNEVVEIPLVGRNMLTNEPADSVTVDAGGYAVVQTSQNGER